MSAFLIDDWSDFDAVSDFDTAYAPVVGVQATSALATITANGGASGVAPGVESTSTAASISGTGTANTQTDGTESTASAGNATGIADGISTALGVQADSSAQAITANGLANVTIDGIRTTAGVATIGANGSVVVNGTATVTGVQGVASAATIVANGAVALLPAGGKPKRRPVKHSDTFLFDKPINATAKVPGVQATASLGTVRPIGVSNSTVQSVSAVATATQITASGIQNPTDEDLLLMLMA